MFCIGRFAGHCAVVGFDLSSDLPDLRWNTTQMFVSLKIFFIHSLIFVRSWPFLSNKCITSGALRRLKTSNRSSMLSALANKRSLSMTMPPGRRDLLARPVLTGDLPFRFSTSAFGAVATMGCVHGEPMGGSRKV
jgi:hypothetical protein